MNLSNKGKKFYDFNSKEGRSELFIAQKSKNFYRNKHAKIPSILVFLGLGVLIY